MQPESTSLEALLQDIEFSCSSPLGDISVRGLANDSRKIVEGYVFVAVHGANLNGNEYIDAAIAQGAVAAVVRRGTLPAQTRESYRVPLVEVDDERLALSYLAQRFYGRPADGLCTIGITGTNGKTSVCWILAELLAHLGQDVLQMGTLGVRTVGSETTKFTPLINTTPDPTIIHSCIAEATDRASYLVMEVSSHGIEQQRVAGMPWHCSVFTNLSRDHLDYHDSMEEYAAVKRRFFTEHLAGSEVVNKFAVVNYGDECGRVLCDELSAVDLKIIRFDDELGAESDVVLVDAKKALDGISLAVEIAGKRYDLECSLLGDYNISNVLAVLAVAHGLSLPMKDVCEVFKSIPAVPGRLELVQGKKDSVVVDYAHTPDALLSAQRSLLEISNGRLITVFGCGGDRDRGKRPLMARAVEELSDVGVLTADNPRSEEPQAIIDDMLAGFRGDKKSFSYLVEPDRKKAIALAIGEANPGDIVLVAGKGHEDYQEINGIRHPFSDREVAQELLTCRDA